MIKLDKMRYAAVMADNTVFEYDDIGVMERHLLSGPSETIGVRKIIDYLMPKKKKVVKTVSRQLYDAMTPEQRKVLLGEGK